MIRFVMPVRINHGPAAENPYGCGRGYRGSSLKSESDISRLGVLSLVAQEGYMVRKATALWRGSGRAGAGEVSTDSGVLARTPY